MKRLISYEVIGEVEHKLVLCDKVVKNTLKEKINSITEILVKYINEKPTNKNQKHENESKKLTDVIKNELNSKLGEFNEYVRTINSNVKGFNNIREVINGFNNSYCDVVGIKKDEKEINIAENGIELFKLFNINKSNEKVNSNDVQSDLNELNSVSENNTEQQQNNNIIKENQHNLIIEQVAGIANEKREMRKSKDNTGNGAQGDLNELNNDSANTNITVDQVFEIKTNTATGKQMTDINLNNCYKYLEQNNFSKLSMLEIASNNNFKKYLFDNAKTGKASDNTYYTYTYKHIINSKIFEDNLIFLYNFIFKPIFQKYEKEENIYDDNKKCNFVNDAFDVLKTTLESMKKDMTKERQIIYVDKNDTDINGNNIKYEIENNMFDKLIKIIKNSEKELLAQLNQKSFITDNDLKNKKIVKKIDKELKRYIQDEKEGFINKLISNLNEEINELKSNKEKLKILKKRVILRAFIDLFNNNHEKYNYLESVYNKHNDYLKKKITIKYDKTQNCCLIKDFQKIINDFDKEGLKIDNEIFNLSC